MSHCLQLMQYIKLVDEHVKLALMWKELLLLMIVVEGLMWVHVRHFGWLQGVVPDCSVVDGNFVRTSMSLIFLSRLYAIRGGD